MKFFINLSLVLVLVLAIGSLVGADEFMTCSRPIKSSRTSKSFNLPCEGMEQGSESWCTLPGPMYPWHAVRNFVFENQGLMRRMYGEVRQLSLLRMEFSGESNAIEEQVSGRDFDDVFQPITVNSLGPSPATTATLVSLLSTVREGEENDEDDEYNDNSGGTSSSSTTETSSPIIIGHSEIHVDDEDDDVNYVNDAAFASNNSNEKLTTIAVEEVPTTSSQGTEGPIDAAITEEAQIATTQMPTDEIEPSDGLVEVLQPPALLISNNASTSSNIKHKNNNANNSSENEENISRNSANGGGGGATSEEKNRIEGYVLFQDYEKSSQPPPPSPTTPSTTTTEEPRVRSRVGVNACPVKEEVVAPYWANNTRGEILALLNLYPFEQYIHWEKCTNEHRQMYCRDGCRCEQQYRLHRLLAFDPSNECRGIFSDWFRFPSCCVCKCYFDEPSNAERVSFNRSPRILLDALPQAIEELDGPDVNGVDDSHFFYKYHHSFRHPRK